MSRHDSNWRIRAVLLGALCGVLAACGGGGGTVDARRTSATTGGSGSSGTSGSGSTTGTNASGGTTTTGGVSSGGVTTSGGGSGGTSGDGGFQSCAAASQKAQSLPLDMYIMLDQSGSMGDAVSGGGDKWSAVTSAINSFLTQPGTAGISVGIQYFPLQAGGSSCPADCSTAANTTACENGGGFCYNNTCYSCGGGGGDSCTASDYATPDVEIAALPGVASAISNSMSTHGPSTSTPTSAALQGAIDHSKSWSQSHQGHVVIDVLATDGDPTECDTNMTNIEAIASAGVSGTPKVLTFVIGVGSSLGNLNGIAQAGGTNQAFIVDTTQNTNQQFLDALNQIRGAALGCSYNVPQPDGGTVDFSQVNVQYTPGNGGAAETIPAVSGASACPSSGDAWYYDNASAPTTIILCPSTCNTVSQDNSGEVDILTGCQTIFK